MDTKVKKTGEIVQTWGCPKCDRRYESFLRVPFTSCSDASHRGKPIEMKLVKGEPYVETEIKEPQRKPQRKSSAHPSTLPKVVVPSRVKKRPKVTRIDSGDALLKSLGLK